LTDRGSRPIGELDTFGTFRKLFEIAPEIMLVVDADGRIVLANPNIELLIGFGADELAGRSVDGLLPERLRAAHARHRQVFTADPQTRSMGVNRNLLARRKDGSEFPVEVALAPMTVGAESFVVASMRDVTESRRAREVTRLRARYSAYLAQLTQVALAARSLDQLLVAMPALLAEALEIEVVTVYLFDTTRTRLLCKGAHGLTETQIEAIHETSDPSSQPGYVLASGEVLVIDDVALETRVRVNPVIVELGIRSAVSVPLFDEGRPSGSLSARAAQPRRFADDEINFMKAAGNVVSGTIHRLHAEERLAHAQRLETVGQLSSGIAHDFNNLITVISGNLQLIQEAAREVPRLAKPVAAALRATGHGASLANKLLAFTRQQVLKPRAVDLAHYLPNLVDMLAHTLGNRIEIRVTVEPALAPCLVDPGMLDNALLNLAINARDAMPQGGRLAFEASEVSHRGEFGAPRERYIRISVTDTGVGMKPEVKARALEPFFTTKETGKGSGLGLSTVFGFVRQSGGQIAIHSEPGNGTVVRLYLPPCVSAGMNDAPLSETPAPPNSGRQG